MMKRILEGFPPSHAMYTTGEHAGEPVAYHHDGINDDAVYAYREETTFTPSGPYKGKNPAVSVRHEWLLRPVEQGPMTLEEWTDRKRMEDMFRSKTTRSGPEYEEFIEHTCWRRH